MVPPRDLIRAPALGKVGRIASDVPLDVASSGTLHGGLAVVGNKVYYGSSRTVHRYNLNDGHFDGYAFSTEEDIDTMAFTGQDYCVSAGSSKVWCYRVRTSHSIVQRWSAPSRKTNKEERLWWLWWLRH